MATNTTTVKKSTATAQESAEAVTATAETQPEPASARAATIVGPAPTAGGAPVTVTLSHHLNIDGTDYRPGAEILVSPDYARRLRSQGYLSRT
ncbi:hypothetical protein ABZV52_29680 [Streptomyces sp. NPDC004735]|uniref:hypothetical protein n=1 Tax=Streptomyces sp. NPDC004735 TaxID=3156654 RepID=UPI0033B806CF